MGATIFATVILLGFPLFLVTTVVLARRLRQAKKQVERYKPIVDIEHQVAEAQRQHSQEVAELEELRKQHQRHEHEHSQRLQSIQAHAQVAAAQEAERTQAQHVEAHSALQQLQQQLAELNRQLHHAEECTELSESGLLAPRFDFGEAVEYKARLEQARAEQERMVKAKKAAVCHAAWTIGGSRAEGKKTTDKILKLMLRAFSGECDALVAKVRFKNAAPFEAKMYRSWEAINKLGTGFTCAITIEYLKLKVQELHLTHEYQEKLQAEREEQRALREQMRDEERASKEIERAQREAEQDEARYEKALERVRAEAEHAAGAQQQRLLEQIAELQQKVAEAEERRQRAVSMAEQTKAGHVYVLSNVGAFGEKVFKVGMTRRIEPQDRVNELGDASVPFPFDIHALIRTDDAPGLEKALHALLDSTRLNKVNRRKEFFSVSLERIEELVRNHHGEFQLTQHAEAMEYRKSLALAQAQEQGPANDAVPDGDAKPETGELRVSAG